MLRERRGIQEIRYRERLFDILSTNVDDIFFIYNKERIIWNISVPTSVGLPALKKRPLIWP